MKNNKNKKIIYGITSSVAVFILGFAIIIGTSTFNDIKVQNSNYGIADLVKDKQNSQESLKIDLQINRIKKMGAAKFDADIEMISTDKIPDEFKFMKSIIIPQEFELINIYKLYVRSNQNIRKYDLLHDYVFEYEKDDENDIRVAISTVAEPIRDYYLGDNDKISKIGEIELRIFQYEKMYMATFKIKNMYFDIETNGIAENELVELLKSIINECEIVNNKNINIEDEDANIKEQPNEEISENYPDYYAGKYVNKKGNNVILLCEDNKTNRKAICNLLGITESKTIFKTAKYSYKYLTELQNKISKKMIEKEFTFVTSSAVMEDSNNIKVTVISYNESDLNKIKELDQIGGAIDIQYSINSVIKKDLLVEKE